MRPAASKHGYMTEQRSGKGGGPNGGAGSAEGVSQQRPSRRSPTEGPERRADGHGKRLERTHEVLNEDYDNTGDGCVQRRGQERRRLERGAPKEDLEVEEDLQGGKVSELTTPISFKGGSVFCCCTVDCHPTRARAAGTHMPQRPRPALVAAELQLDGDVANAVLDDAAQNQSRVSYSLTRLRASEVHLKGGATCDP